MITMVPSYAMLTIGCTSSRTVTVKEQSAELPLASVAVQWTVVVPAANTEPDAGVQLMVGEGSQLSVAVAEKLTVAPEGLVQLVTIFAGQLITGRTVSATVKMASSLVTEPTSFATTTLYLPASAAVTLAIV